MKNDPIIDEVRKIRRQIEKDCNGDLSKIFQHARQMEKSSVKDRIKALKRAEKERLVTA